MDAKKTILLNGLITLAGLLLDIYGLYDLSLSPALLGLIIGIVDCVTFVWMREEIKQKLAQWKRNWSVARPHVMDTWLKDMEQRKPQVVATIIGRSVLTRVLRLAREMGYAVANISESESWLFKKYNVTFRAHTLKHKMAN